MNARFKYWKWRIVDLLGKQGLIAIVVLIASFGFWLSVISQTTQSRALQNELNKLKQRAQVADYGTSEKSPDPIVKLFQRDEVSGVLSELLEQLELLKLEVSSARYEHLPRSVSAPALLEVRLELNGKYPVLRAFLSKVWNDLPDVALREISMRRVAPDSDTLTTVLRLAIPLSTSVESRLR